MAATKKKETSPIEEKHVDRLTSEIPILDYREDRLVWSLATLKYSENERHAKENN
jgi:hypothetical protein